LTQNKVKAFYDAYEEADLWGKDLYVHLHEVYSKQARYCVIFCSKSYASKLWTSHERRAAQERAFVSTNAEYILPVKIDQTDIPGLPATVGHVSISVGPEQLCQIILKKLTANHT